MIRGAFIFAIGLSVGYVKGLTDAEKIIEGLKTVVDGLKEVSENLPTDKPVNDDVIEGDVVQSDEPISADLNEGDKDGSE